MDAVKRDRPRSFLQLRFERSRLHRLLARALKVHGVRLETKIEIDVAQRLERTRDVERIGEIQLRAGEIKLKTRALRFSVERWRRRPLNVVSPDERARVRRHGPTGNRDVAIEPKVTGPEKTRPVSQGGIVVAILRGPPFGPPLGIFEIEMPCTRQTQASLLRVAVLLKLIAPAPGNAARASICAALSSDWRQLSAVSVSD